MDQCRGAIELGYAERVGEDQHGALAVDAVRERAESDAFRALARNAQVKIEIFIQDVAIDERECREDDAIRAPGQWFEANEQIKSADVERSRRRVVDADSPAWRSRVEVQPRRARNAPPGCSPKLLDLDACYLPRVVGTVDLPPGPVEHHVRCDQRSRCSDTGDVFEIREDGFCEKLVERIVLCITLVAQPERHGMPVFVEKPLPKSEKRDRRKIDQRRYSSV